MAVVLALIVPSLATAQTPCLSRPEMIARLAAGFGEVPLAAGVTANGGLLEVLTSPEGATWSILVTSPRGQSCLVAAGENWRARTTDETDHKPAPGERGA